MVEDLTHNGRSGSDGMSESGEETSNRARPTPDQREAKVEVSGVTLRAGRGWERTSHIVLVDVRRRVLGVRSQLGRFVRVRQGGC